MDSEYFAKMSMPCAEIGRALACSSDKEQAETLNALAKELRIICRDKDLSGMQVCYIARSLDGNARKLIQSLEEFIRLEEEADGGV
jgi:hypothetical protein